MRGSSRIESQDVRPLHAFIEEHNPASAVMICNERGERVVGRIRVMSYIVFLRNLWTGKIVR